MWHVIIDEIIVFKQPLSHNKVVLREPQLITKVIIELEINVKNWDWDLRLLIRVLSYKLISATMSKCFLAI